MDPILINNKMMSSGGARVLAETREETIACGRALAGILIQGDVLALDGDLGAGKTTFVKGLALGLGLDNPDEVKSPTFVLMHIYQAKVPIYHFDLYRLDEAKDYEAIGLQDFSASGEAVTCIEWADKAATWMPQEYYHIQIRVLKGDTREILITKKRNAKYKS